jgi:hypothetical protein
VGLDEVGDLLEAHGANPLLADNNGAIPIPLTHHSIHHMHTMNVLGSLNSLHVHATTGITPEDIKNSKKEGKEQAFPTFNLNSGDGGGPPPPGSGGASHQPTFHFDFGSAGQSFPWQ